MKSRRVLNSNPFPALAGLCLTFGLVLPNWAYSDSNSNGNGQNSPDNSFSELTTTSGETFTSVPSDPVLKEGWRDPRGKVWYDIIVDDDGSPIKMNHETATLYCEAHNARLPFMEDCMILARWFSVPISKISSVYTPQILPNLDKLFWTLRVYDAQSSDPTALIFIGSKGILYRVDTTKTFPVRCVRDTNQ